MKSTDFFDRFTEIQQFGYNTLTVSFLGTALFSLLIGVALYMQMNKIFEMGTARSQPIVMNQYFCWHYLAFMIYGFRINSLAAVINGSLFFLFQVNYEAAMSMDDAPRRKLWHFLPILFVPAMLICDRNQKEIVLAATMICANFFMWQAPIAVWKSGIKGSVDMRLLSIFQVNLVFWVVLTFMTKQHILLVAGVLGFISNGLTMFLWYVFPHELTGENPLKDMWRKFKETDASF